MGTKIWNERQLMWSLPWRCLSIFLLWCYFPLSLSLFSFLIFILFLFLTSHHYKNNPSSHFLSTCSSLPYYSFTLYISRVSAETKETQGINADDLEHHTGYFISQIIHSRCNAVSEVNLWHVSYGKIKEYLYRGVSFWFNLLIKISKELFCKF